MTPTQEDWPAEQFDAWLALTGQVPAPSETVWLPMLSGSMAPAIPVGALLEIVVRPGHHCRTGDVAVFRMGDKLVAHRVLMVVGFGSWRRVLEKGDANPGGRWRPASAICGKVAGFAATREGSRQSPDNPDLARRHRWHHLRNWLVTFGGRRPTKMQETGHD